MAGKFLFFVGLLLGLVTFSQKGVTTFGIEYKPIVPNRIIGTFEQDFNEGAFNSTIRQKIGHSFGMVVRQGLNDVLSFETGLAITQRNFNLEFNQIDSNLTAKSKVGLVGYEIPISALVFIRLADDWYMNTTLGASLNYFPSDVQVEVPLDLNEYFQQEGARLNRIQGALLANIGVEYRTKKKGYFYGGFSYNLPFQPIYTFAMSYEFPPGKLLAIDNIRGSYLTLDFRYYFHEKPKSESKK
jgi:hypothetical protein